MPPKNSTLIITEKPQAAIKIASALSNGKDEKITTKDNVSYYQFQKNNKNYIVGCAVGHLFGIQQTSARGTFPNFEVEWQPTFNTKASAFTKKYYNTLKTLAKDADEFIVATDFDVEGELIGWNVIRFICNKKDAKRMKFSSLTKDALQESFDNLMPSLNWGSAIAGESRHYIDWYYGINLSRGLMKALAKTGQFRILSIGRVQGPALKILVDKEIEIKNFKSETYWQIFLQIQDIKKQKAEVKYIKDVFNKSDLLKFKHLQGKQCIARTEISEEKISPPVPFDLTTLQTESYKNFGLTPSQTLKIAQALYLEGVISYPRTSSQKYPVGINYDKILNQLKKYTTLTKYAVNKSPVQGSKEDPAHPAIYPTGEIKVLKDIEKKVYDLIAKRFIACFCDSAIVENKKIIAEINDLKFTAYGLKIIEKNWLNVYPNDIKENDIPTINGNVDILEIRTEEKQTQPPRRYSAASLIRELEKQCLGTKATRAQIIDTLYSRGYIKDKSISVTELGLKMEATLSKYSPIILDKDLTKQMTEKLELMETSNKNLEKQEKDILDEAKKEVVIIAKQMTENIDAIGKSLADANEKIWEQEKQDNTMTACPVCGKGNLRVMFGKKYKRYFVSCNAYPKCKTIYSLPPYGLMKPAKNKEGDFELCQECKFPMVISLQKGKMPWKFCFNPNCITNKDLQKKKQDFKDKLEKEKAEATANPENSIAKKSKKPIKKKTITIKEPKTKEKIIKPKKPRKGKSE